MTFKTLTFKTDSRHRINERKWNGLELRWCFLFGHCTGTTEDDGLPATTTWGNSPIFYVVTKGLCNRACPPVGCCCCYNQVKSFLGGLSVGNVFVLRPGRPGCVSGLALSFCLSPPSSPPDEKFNSILIPISKKSGYWGSWCSHQILCILYGQWNEIASCIYIRDSIIASSLYFRFSAYLGQNYNLPTQFYHHNST